MSANIEVLNLLYNNQRYDEIIEILSHLDYIDLINVCKVQEFSDLCERNKNTLFKTRHINSINNFTSAFSREFLLSLELSELMYLNFLLYGKSKCSDYFCNNIISQMNDCFFDFNNLKMLGGGIRQQVNQENNRIVTELINSFNIESFKIKVLNYIVSDINKKYNKNLDYETLKNNWDYRDLKKIICQFSIYGVIYFSHPEFFVSKTVTDALGGTKRFNYFNPKIVKYGNKETIQKIELGKYNESELLKNILPNEEEKKNKFIENIYNKLPIDRVELKKLNLDRLRKIFINVCDFTRSYKKIINQLH